MKKKLKKIIGLIEKTEEYLKNYQFVKVSETISNIKKELLEIYRSIEKREKKKLQDPSILKAQARHFMGWYLKLWNNEPPESFLSPEYQAIIYKTAKKLLEIYSEKNEGVEELKKDYEKFLEDCKLKKRKVSFRGITAFSKSLPDLKATTTNEWGETRGKDVYLSLLDDL